MLIITNKKVAGFTPNWASFRGFSILFDNPGQCLTRCGNRLDLTCDVVNGEGLEFYRSLHHALASLDVPLLTNAFLFCPLPPLSYHVTVWDGGNDENLAQVKDAHYSDMKTLLAGLPDALLHPNATTQIPMASPLVANHDWAIRFRFESLAKWGNIVLVARLAPADDVSTENFQRLVEERARLNVQFREAVGVSPSDKYTPHVSLGYFANKEMGQLATPYLTAWNAGFQEGLDGATLDFYQASLYGFTDMASFFKEATGVE